MRHSRTSSIALAALLLPRLVAPATDAVAQSGDHRAMLAAWEARVDSVAAEDRLLPLLDSAVAGEWKDPRELGLVRRGLVERRLGELTGNRRYFDESLEDFWAAASRHRDWPYAWYGLARAKLAMSVRQLPPYTERHQPAGSSYSEEADTALVLALEADPDFTPARRTLARSRATLRPPTDSAAALLERAGEQFAAGLSEGAIETYYAAVSRAGSPKARERLRSDLAWIADEVELAEFDRLRPAALRSWVEAFWERRDVRDARKPGERLAEHYRRLAYARLEFLRVGDGSRHTRGQRYRGNRSDMDDRAVIYIRHGRPDGRAAFASPFNTADALAPVSAVGQELPERPDDATAVLPPNLSWKYERPGGDLIFHFVAEAGKDYRLIESLLDVFSVDTVIRLGFSDRGGVLPAYEEARYARPLIASRAELDPMYARIAARSHIGGSAGLLQERATGQRSLSVGTTTDSYTHPLGADFDAAAQVYVVTRNGEGRLLVVLGVQRKELAYPVGVRVILSTRDDRRLMQSDTVVPLAPLKLAGEEYLGGYLELPAPEGVHQLRTLVTDSALRSTAVGPAQEVVVPAPGSALALGDVVLGAPGGLVWPGPDGPVALNPAGHFRSGTSAELYYRVSGLSPNSAYRTTIEIRSAGKDRTRRIVSTFGMVATASRQVERRRLALQRLKPGDYLMAVTVSGPGGAATSTVPLRVE